jgi:hypothetical protein
VRNEIKRIQDLVAHGVHLRTISDVRRKISAESPFRLGPGA